MPSTFGSLQIGVRALQAHQLALEVTGQNIANVDTSGYSRQVAVLTTTDPYNNPSGAGQVGTGVEVAAIISMRDKFIDAQIRSANSVVGKLEAEESVYQYMETVFNETSDSAISDYVDQFWSDLQELSTNASDPTTRSAVLESANSLVGAISDTYNQLLKLQNDCDNQVETLVDQVNSLAEQVADLNKVIRQVTATGQSANDLMDQREQLTQQLSELVNISVQTTSTNEYNITIGGVCLVSGSDTYKLETAENAAGHLDVVWDANGAEANISGGQIGGYLEMRDDVVAGYMADLDTFASTLITEFNAVHNAGYDLDGNSGVDFFSGSGAADLKVAITNYNEIAASTSSGSSGNGENATALADVINTEKFIDNMTLDQYYNTIVSRLALNANVCYSLHDNKQNLADYLTQQQSSVSGVSQDEEAANLIIYENAYNAASRYVTVIDEMLETLINSTGVVGL